LYLGILQYKETNLPRSNQLNKSWRWGRL